MTDSSGPTGPESLPGGSGVRRPPWPEFRKALDELGFHPSRRLGQNFLLDENLVRCIADDAELQPGEFVLEVGPGCGFLSVHLADLGVELLAVEIDGRLFEISTRFLGPFEAARVVRADILAGKHQLAPEVEVELPEDRTWHLVSNLPYAVSAPVLALCAARENPPASMTVLVQKEVGDRMVASPGTSDWGPLSVALQLAYRARTTRNVGPGSFWPRPKVDSSVIRLELREDRAPAEQRALFLGRVRALFSRRRQSLGRVLGDEWGDKALAKATLEEIGVDPKRRAETLEWPELRALNDCWQRLRPDN